MVDLASAHHPSNCLQDNRNHFDDSNVATTKSTPTALASKSSSSSAAAAAAASKDFLSSFCINSDAITLSNSIGSMEYDRGNQMQCQQQHQYRNHWHRCIKNDEPNNNSNNNNSSNSSGSSDCYRRRYRRHPCHQHQQYHRKNTPIFQCNGMQKKNAAGVLSHAHGIIVNSSNLSNLLILFAILSLFILNIDVINAEPQQPMKTTTPTTTVAKLSAVLAATTKTPATSEQQQCEPKVLDETPPDPFYDAYDITIDAARKLADYLNSIRPVSTITPEIRNHANVIASESLQEDEGLLAIAIAAPSLKLAVVQFRDVIELAPEVANNHTLLRAYWRELGLAWNHTEGAEFWGPPFRDCGALRGRWLWPYSVNFQANGIKTVASTFIAADDNPCNDALEHIFGKKHSCDTETTFCLQSKPNETASGVRHHTTYTCLCNIGYYVPNQTLQGFEGLDIESQAGNYSCIRCPGGCMHCDSKGNCSNGDAEEYFLTETLLRFSIGVILGSCMFSCLTLAIIVFRQRKCKTISSGMWTVLEIILLGILLMYASVGLHFLPASTVRCLLEPWFRELGFIVCYGAIILKLYRHLVEFRTRKAHRWVLRDVDLLKYLSSMIFAVVCYMSAFTASSIDLIQTAALDGLQEEQTNTCQQMKWEFVTQFSEILILAFGLHLAIASRNANTQFRERHFLVASISAEFLISVVFYIFRAIYLNSWGPGTIFLILFLRSQFTNTLTMGLIFLPKLWYQHKQGAHDSSHHGGAYAGIYLGDPDIGTTTISEMSPEDIRAELKSKRRGGRKPAHRRFSLQKKGSRDKALSAKHRSHRHHAHETEMTEAEPSRTPEDSVCSVEGPTETGGEPSAAFSTTKSGIV